MNHVEVAKLRQAAVEAGTILKTIWQKNITEMPRENVDFAPPADFVSQELIVQHLFAGAPDVPILVEEQDQILLKEIRTQCPGVNLLTASDDEDNLPPDYYSSDPLDGSALFTNHCPEFSVSIALVKNHHPEIAVVHMPIFSVEITACRGHGCFINGLVRIKLDEQRPLHECLIGLDSCKAVDSAMSRRVILPLTSAFRYVRNLPSVACGIELLLGRTAAWVSTNARNWDIAGTALAVQEAGGIAECLDGSPIPWNRVRMPSLLFAANQRIAHSVRQFVGY